MSWHLGLFVVIALPATVFMVAVFWPDRAPKDRTVQAIRKRIEQENADG
ncbi:hypothetical protein [Nocardia sp. N2S4-5]